MTQPGLRVHLRGVRGTIPVSGEDFRIFGGNTICTEIRCGEHILLFDAGSGLAQAGAMLRAEGVRQFRVFFSHCHYDHIIGLTDFLPFLCPDSSIELWSGHLHGTMTTREMVRDFVRPPWFPVGPDVFRASKAYHDFAPGEVLTPFPDVTIRTGMLNHPGGAIGFRIEWGGRKVAIVTDTEHVPGTLDPVVLELIDGVDLFLYDASYTDAEMELKRGFGHSSWQQALRLAEASGARRVGFIHHAPRRTDIELTEIERQARGEFPGAFCGRDGQVIEL